MPVLSYDEVAAVAIRGGFPPGPAAIAVAITNPESSRDDEAIQKGQPYATTGWGLWQITPGNSEPQCGIDKALLDPLNNARAAVAKWRGSGQTFGPWTTYMDGAYGPYLHDAELAVERVAHLSAAQLAALVAAARKGTPAGGGGASGQDWSAYVAATSVHFSTAGSHLHTYAAAARGLTPSFTRPTVLVPDPAGLLWQPGRSSGGRNPAGVARGR